MSTFKKFQVLKDKAEVLAYESESKDAYELSEDKKRITFKLPGDKLKELESTRFNGLKVTNKDETLDFMARSFTKVLDNNVTVIRFYA